MKKLLRRAHIAMVAAVLCTSFVSEPSAAQDAASTLPSGVHPVSPTESKSVIDPEQLDERTPGHLVQDLHAVFGARHVRAVHSKGYILEGTFSPSPKAFALSSANVFVRPVPVIVRFSDFTGLPQIPDTNPLAQPRGLAIKFMLPDGSNLDIVSHSFNGFPTPTSADFGDLLLAIAASGPDAAKPTKLDTYLEGHPAAKRFLTTQGPAPQSWATAQYYGVNAFQFTNAAGKVSFVRYRFVPAAGRHYLSDAELATKKPDYLSEEIAKRVSSGPIRFEWYAQIATKTDDIADPSTAWPESRKLVRLGTITIDRSSTNSALADRSLIFLPGSVLPGIAVADPMLTIRNATYPISVAERREVAN